MKPNGFLIAMILTIGVGSGLLAEQPIYQINDKTLLKEIIEKNEITLQSCPNDVASLKTLGIAYHNLSVLGERKASDSAKAYLIKCDSLTKSSDPEVMAYLGSAHTLSGRDAIIPITKILRVRKGTRIINNAIKKAPDNTVVRMVRIANSLSLPSFFGRLKYVESDAMHLIKLRENNPDKFDDYLLASIYYNLGEYYYRKDKLSKAIINWERAITFKPESDDGRKAQKRLNQYRK